MLKNLLLAFALVLSPIALVACGGSSTNATGTEVPNDGKEEFSAIRGECLKVLDDELPVGVYWDLLSPEEQESAASSALRVCYYEEIVPFVKEYGGDGEMELVRMCGLDPPCEEMTDFDPGGARIRAACNRLAEDVGRDADEWRYFCGAGQGRNGRDDEAE